MIEIKINEENIISCFICDQLEKKYDGKHISVILNGLDLISGWVVGTSDGFVGLAS